MLSVCSNGESGQIEVVGKTDQSDAVKAHGCADAQGRTAGQSVTVEFGRTCFS